MYKIKILNILTGGLRREGIVSTQLELIKHMDLENYQMDYVAVHNNEEDVIKEFENNKCNVYIMPDRKQNLFEYIKELDKLMKKEKYQIVHIHGSSTIMAIELFIALKNKIKVRIAHSRNTQCMNNKSNKIFRPLFNVLYTDAFACGKDAGEWLFPNKKFVVFHNGKDIEKFKYDEDMREKIRDNLGLKKDFVIGFVGNLNEQKNLFFLLECFNAFQEKYKDAKLILIGEGHLHKALSEKISEFNIQEKVIFTGRIKNVNEYLQAIDVMCLPSLYEGLPNVVLEWQISGLDSLISDKVTKECAVTDYVEFLGIESNQKWVEKLEELYLCRENKNRQFLSNIGCENIKKNLFEINTNAKYLEEYYKKRFSECYE